MLNFSVVGEHADITGDVSAEVISVFVCVSWFGCTAGGAGGNAAGGLTHGLKESGLILLYVGNNDHVHKHHTVPTVLPNAPVVKCMIHAFHYKADKRFRLTPCPDYIETFNSDFW